MITTKFRIMTLGQVYHMEWNGVWTKDVIISELDTGGYYQYGFRVAMGH